jgi:hypothetical protein
LLTGAINMADRSGNQKCDEWSHKPSHFQTPFDVHVANLAEEFFETPLCVPDAWYLMPALRAGAILSDQQTAGRETGALHQ